MTATYRAPFQAHAAMEPLNCVAHVRDGQCEIWVGTQAPNQAQEAVAKLLGIPLERVTIHVVLLGGGFGRRLGVDYVLEAVEVSRKVGGPVQVVWSREDDIRHDMYQPGQVNRLTASLDARGMPVAWRHEVADYNLTMFGDVRPELRSGGRRRPLGWLRHAVCVSVARRDARARPDARTHRRVALGLVSGGSLRPRMFPR